MDYHQHHPEGIHTSIPAARLLFRSPPLQRPQRSSRHSLLSYDELLTISTVSR